MGSLRKIFFYLYVALLLHLVGFIILMPDSMSKIRQMLQRMTNQTRQMMPMPRVNNIIVESYQQPSERPRRRTPFISEHFSPARGRMTRERGYNVTTPMFQEEQSFRRRKKRHRVRRRILNEPNPTIRYRDLPANRYPALNLPRLKTRDTDQLVMNFDQSGKPSFNTRAFPNVKYFIDVAKTTWQYLVTFAPKPAVFKGTMKNSAVLLGINLNKKGEITKVWIQDSTSSNTLDTLSSNAITFIKENVGGYGKQPPNFKITTVFAYFYIGRNYDTYQDEQVGVRVEMKGIFYFRYKKKRTRRR